ncbi:MAG TPA: FAD/NAD(P)-binding protein [Acidimicrobiales bacterium]|nr:FAD/NAD(P)-binding protein [Acidimicrobiales bacterium]
MEVGVIGLGSWGLCVLERLLDRARTVGTPVRIHVVEPGTPGGGVYTTDQPDYLVLNNPCGQLSLYAVPDGGREPPYGLGLYEWAVRAGYRWVGDDCRVTPHGRALDPADFLPRRLMGEYLAWFFGALVADAPPNIEVVVHRDTAVGVAAEGGRERIALASCGSLHVDHVVLTSGHTYNLAPDELAPAARLLRPYPVTWFEAAPGPGEPIVIAGMGLVACDLLTAMTVGRGGAFEPVGDRLRYRPSGREPQLLLYSRTGIPPLAKPASAADPTGDYRSVICTAGRLGRLRPGSIDFRADVLPLLLAEMQVRYYLRASGDRALPERLGAAWSEGWFATEVARLAARHGAYDPARHFDGGLDEPVLTSKDYEQQVYEHVAADLDEALAGPARSPLKAALETTRILRDELRSVLEFQALTLDSYLDFHRTIRPRINRIEAGPPLLRSQQLLALLDAGVVRLPWGPSPVVTPEGAGVRVRSTALLRPHEETARGVIRGHLDLPSLVQSASPLLRSLHEGGRLQPLRYGDVAVGSVAIDEAFHPLDRDGNPETRLSVLGVLTEGVRYFTHYLPSPKSRLRAVLDAQACAESVIG